MRRFVPALFTLAAACHADRATAPRAGEEVALADGLVAGATASVTNGDFVGPMVLVSTVITNRGAETGSVTVGASCTVVLRIFRVGGPPVPTYDESGQVCTLPARVITLAPGAADTIVRYVDVWRAAAGGPSGRYRVDALLSADHDPHAGTGRVVLPAGTVTIP